jgi:hypothetical protein
MISSTTLSSTIVAVLYWFYCSADIKWCCVTFRRCAVIRGGVGGWGVASKCAGLYGSAVSIFAAEGKGGQLVPPTLSGSNSGPTALPVFLRNEEMRNSVVLLDLLY